VILGDHGGLTFAIIAIGLAVTAADRTEYLGADFRHFHGDAGRIDDVALSGLLLTEQPGIALVAKPEDQDFRGRLLAERRSMKKPTVKYGKGEIGRVRIVEDFLPSPDRLVLREDNVKVTLSLSQRSVAFFKRAARQRRVPYQRMIRALVDAYAEKQEGKG